MFDQDRYFDVFVEYAKESPEDILIQISVHNRGPEPAELHVLPTLWFRNQWSWHGGSGRPGLREVSTAPAHGVVEAVDPKLGERYLYCEGDVPLLFTENETNTQRIFGVANRSPYVKDSINDYVVHGQQGGGESREERDEGRGALSAERAAGECQVVRLRLSDVAPAAAAGSNGDRGRSLRQPFRRGPSSPPQGGRRVLRSGHSRSRSTPTRPTSCARPWRACCGASSSTTTTWTSGWRSAAPIRSRRSRKAAPRNDHWHHMYNGDVISMPDKWEYPWYAAWDLAFHVLALTLVDPDFGKQQLKLMLRERYMHPNGQIPAYEWNFGDVNPPVHAWSTIFTYRLEKAQKGEGDRDWLKSCFQKLLLNFTWWVNRKDRSGRNVFEGGFLGLDNIGVFDRSAPLPTGGYLEQADGTAWMALFCQNMLEIAVGAGA